MLRKAFVAAVLLAATTAFGFSPVEKENLFEEYKSKIQYSAQNFNQQSTQKLQTLLLSKFESEVNEKLFIKALSLFLLEYPEHQALLHGLNLERISLSSYAALIDTLGLQTEFQFSDRFNNEWRHLTSSEKLLICSFQKSESIVIQNAFSKNPPLSQECLQISLNIQPPSAQKITQLVVNTPDARDYKNGTYFAKPIVFQFCRTNRQYTCLQVIKDQYGNWVRNHRGDIWNQATLSLSRYGKDYNQFNGNTPAGAYTLDGVMPHANNQPVYGRFRRLIISFIPQSSNENTTKALLPVSHHSENWWKEAVVARDMGRDLFRIHGTLRRNDDKSSSFYPYYPTAGCVATKEGVYDDVDYIEQRHLLDELMKASGMQPVHSNETQILSRFYVIEINSQNAPVTMNDLKAFGVSL